MADFVQKLHIEDALDDSPQMKSMVNLFEKDSNDLKKYFKAISSSCQKIMNAQSTMLGATQELTYYLRLFDKQNFQLETQTTKISDTLSQFANFIDEISSLYQVFFTQLNDTMMLPLNNFIDHDFDDLYAQSELYKMTSEEKEHMLQKFLKLPLRKDNEQQRQLANEEVFMFQKKFHNTAMNYYQLLNGMQYKRKYMIYEPLVQFMHGIKLFFKMGVESLNAPNSKLDNFLNDVSTDIHKVKDELAEETNKTSQLIELIQQDSSIYYAESQHTQMALSDLSNTFYKSGYLNLKSNIPLLSIWNRYYYFTQNGCLMQQDKNEIVGTTVMELKSDLVISPVGDDERRFVFQISSLSPKKTITLQANNERDREEWIKILSNIIKDDSKTKLQNYMSNNPSVTSLNAKKELLNNVIRFEFDGNCSKDKVDYETKKSNSLFNEAFDVRFLGSMNVKADRGNEYIHDTIRQVMAERARKNIFKMNQLKLLITNDSLAFYDDSVTQLKCEFSLNDIAFWSTHRENNRLFGFIMKEKKQLKFHCHVFESDVNSDQICESITKSTQIAFKNLIDLNKLDKIKKIREAEKRLLLQNISLLPDKDDVSPLTESKIINEEDDDALINVSEAAFNSPNPNFFILESDDLDLVKSSSTYDIADNSKTDASSSHEQNESEA